MSLRRVCAKALKKRGVLVFLATMMFVALASAGVKSGTARHREHAFNLKRSYVRATVPKAAEFRAAANRSGLQRSQMRFK